MEAILDVQTIQPNATPTVFETPKTDSIPASAAGYVPNPLFVKANVKLPTAKAVIIVPKPMVVVSSRAKRAV